MSANLLDGLTPNVREGAVSADGTLHFPARASGAAQRDWLYYDLQGQSALKENQTYHVGVSLRGASASGDHLRPFIGYKDAAGNKNWVLTPFLSVGTSWGRAEGTLVVPSGMTPFTFGVQVIGTCPETWMASPTLSLGSPVPLASSAHTPYATQDHVSTVYATKASLKVTDDSIKAEVSARAQTDRNVADLSSRLTQTANSLTSEISDRRTAITTVTGLANAAQSTADAAKSTVDGMKLGGRNLLKGTSMDVVTGTYPSSSYKDCLKYQTIDVPDGDTYTLSFDAKSTHAGDILHCYFYNPNTTLTGLSSTGMKFDSGSNPDGFLQVKLTSDWQRYWCTWTQSATTERKNVIPFRCQSGDGTGTVSMRGVKLEAGNKATDWTPAPEDTDSAVADAKKAGTDAQSSANAAQTMATENQSSIKQLSTSITAEVTARTKTDRMVSDLSSRLTQTANSLTSEISDRRTAITTVTGLANAAQSTADAAKSTVDGMKLGGRNLLKGTSMDVVTGTYPSSSYKDCLKYQTIDVPDGDTYTLSFDAKSTHAGDILHCYFYNPNTTLTGLSSTGMKFDSGSNPDGFLQVKLTSDWQRYWCTWTQSATTERKNVIPFRCQSGDGTGTVSMRGVKLEAGNKATDWTPAPEDTDSAVADAKKAGTDAQSSANAAQTMATENQSSIKQLSTSITAEVTARTKTDRMVSDLSSRLTQTENSLTSEISDRRTAITTVTGLANAAQSTADAAKSSASNAVSTANSASSSAANAVETANAASSAASAASTAAGKALTDAAAAVKTANSASSTASGAVTTANSAKSTANAASDTATAAKTMATENQSSIKQLSNSITSEVTQRTKTDRMVSDLSSKLTQTADGFNASIDRLSDTDKKVNSWFGFGADASGNPQLTMGSSSSPVVGVYTNTGLAYRSRSGATLLELDGASRSSTMPHVHADDVSMGSWQWVPTQNGTHFTLQWIGG